MPDVNCNLCGADDYKVLFPEGAAQVHRIVRCNQCGLMYANPQKLVDCETFISKDHPRTYSLKDNARGFQKQNAQLPDNLRVLRNLDQFCPNRGRLLEIGCHLGIFLDRVRSDGWTVTGLEPEPAAANYARSKYELDIVEKLLTDAKFEDARFDAIIMMHVIEHMPDPALNVKEIRRILKPGGVFVVETPRFDSLMFKLLGRRERSLSNCNSHIYFFTVPTLRRLLEKSGFAVERVDLVGRTLTLDRFLFNVGLVSRIRWLQEFFSWLGNACHLEKIRFHVNVHDIQRIYCRAK